MAVWRMTATGLEVRIRLTPKSSRDKIEGTERRGNDEVLKARVRAVPENGLANAAAEELLAAWLGVPRRSVALASGGKSRIKVIGITGDGHRLAGLIKAALKASTTT